VTRSRFSARYPFSARISNFTGSHAPNTSRSTTGITNQMGSKPSGLRFVHVVTSAPFKNDRAAPEHGYALRRSGGAGGLSERKRRPARNRNGANVIEVGSMNELNL
jgi:hypothetical protein